MFTKISQLTCNIGWRHFCTLLKYMLANIACKKLSATKCRLMTALSSSHRPGLKWWENHDKSASSFLQLFLMTVPLSVDTKMSSLGPLIIWPHCVSQEGVSSQVSSVTAQGQSKSVAADPGIVRAPRDVRWGGAGAEARGSHQYRIHRPGGERHRVWRV